MATVCRGISGGSSIFLALNRNKRSLCVDLATREGAAVLARLVSSADVFVHNMRIGAIERLRCGRGTKPTHRLLRRRRLRPAGSDCNKPAFDDVIQAASGVAAMASIDDGHFLQPNAIAHAHGFPASSSNLLCRLITTKDFNTRIGLVRQAH